jgi:hypothetical protein
MRVSLYGLNGLREKMEKFVHRHPFWNIKDDSIVKAFNFGREDRPLQNMALKGILFEEENKTKTPYAHGGSQIISLEPSMLKKYGFFGKPTRQRVLMVKECGFVKPDSPLIMICREQDEKTDG